MFIKLYDEIPEEAKTIREAVFIKEQGYTGLNDIHMDEYCPHTWMRKNLAV